GDDAPALAVAAEALLGAGASLDDGVDGLEVAGVGGHGDVDAPAAGEGALAGVPLVVLHIAAAVGVVLFPVILELGEDLLIRLSEDVIEDVEPAAVGHAEDDFLSAEACGVLDGGVEQGDGALGALEAESLVAGVSLAEEAFEDLGLEELAEDMGPLAALQM